MKTITIFFLLFSVLLLSSCTKEDNAKDGNKEIFTEAIQWGWAWVPEKTQKLSR